MISPAGFRLKQNYPNPFNPDTVIQYSLAFPSRVSLTVYDISGRVLALLVNRKQSAGSYSLPFHAHHLSGGVYRIRLKAGRFSETRKMILLK